MKTVEEKLFIKCPRCDINVLVNECTDDFRCPECGARIDIVADLFCGAGGSSTGAVRAAQEMDHEIFLVCINHWPVAIDTHRKNHPEAMHYIENVTIADPYKIVPWGFLHLLMASPECRYYSRARGGKPVYDQARMNPWVVLKWLTALEVRSLLVENVPEFVQWGPLLPNGKPDPKQKGIYFQAWYNAIRDLGYKIEWKYLCAADYGDATTRVRFFLIARKDGKSIRWPSATHSETGNPDMLGQLPKWKAAREVINWGNPGRSILDDPKYKKHPLAANTMRRIARGFEKFGGALAPYYIRLLKDPGQNITDCHIAGQPEPFIMGKQGHSPAYRKLDQPMQTITADGRPVLIEPDLRPFILNRNGENGSDRIHDPDKPLPTATTRGAGYLVTPEARPFIVQNRIRPDGDRIFDIDKPVMTVTGHGAGALIEPMMVKYYGTADVTPVDLPLPSITTKGRFGLVDPILVEVNHEGPDRTGSVNKPLKTITSKRGTAIVSPFVVAWDNSKAHGDQVWSAEQPIPTIVTKANKGILMPIIEAIKSGQVDPRRLILIDGIPYMLDILFRMISNPELAKAMSFTNEEFTYEFVGTGEDITRQIGNAVPVETAKALVKVIL